ncbi:hypothetical protein EJB05_08795, partial [Eragrostis curvula]
MSSVTDTSRRRSPANSPPATAPPIQPAGEASLPQGDPPWRGCDRHKQCARPSPNFATSLAGGSRAPTKSSNLQATHGASSSKRKDVVNRVQDEEAIEEFYGQLWAVPSEPKPRVSVAAATGRGALFWVRKELVRARKFGIEDCYRVSRFDRIEAPPIHFSYSRDLWVWKNRRETYADILRMAEGSDQGRWVWQPQRPQRPPPRPQMNYNNQRGPPPPPPPQQQPHRGGGNQGGGRGRFQQQPPPSERQGLGLYHVDVPDEETTQWLNFKNCGVVNVITGEVDIAEMERELSAIFCKEWPWQIRELDKGQFLVRFPPHKKVSDIKNLPSFNLRKEGVRVEVLEWVGELDPFEELQEVWVEVSGIPPKWCAWSVFAQVSSSFGMMTDVEWPSLFKSFYEKVRIKVACRDPSKIPMERIFEMNKKLYYVYFEVEDAEQTVTGRDDKNDGGPGGDDDADEDFDGLGEESGSKPMDTENGSAQNESSKNQKQKANPSTAPKGSKTVGLQPTMEDDVEEFLTGAHLFQEEQVAVTINLDETQSGPDKDDASNIEKKEVEMMQTSQQKAIQDATESYPEQLDSSQKSKWLEFMEQGDEENSVSRCTQLLRNMEMVQSDTESEKEEEERHFLSKEMIEQMSAKRNLFDELNKCADEEVQPKESKKQKKEKVWGPILPCRKSSRNMEDGRTMLEKAQSNKKHRNLERPAKHGNSKVNSFAALDSEYLAHISKTVNLEMGNDMDECVRNIEAIKANEARKLDNFLNENPEVLLPESIDVIDEIEMCSQEEKTSFKN